MALTIAKTSETRPSRGTPPMPVTEIDTDACGANAPIGTLPTPVRVSATFTGATGKYCPSAGMRDGCTTAIAEEPADTPLTTNELPTTKAASEHSHFRRTLFRYHFLAA